jgi:hypothetical protein
MMNLAITDPDPATTGKARGTIGPDGLEPGTAASRAGRSKMAFVNRTGAVKGEGHFLCSPQWFTLRLQSLF